MKFYTYSIQCRGQGLSAVRTVTQLANINMCATNRSPHGQFLSWTLYYIPLKALNIVTAYSFFVRGFRYSTRTRNKNVCTVYNNRIESKCKNINLSYSSLILINYTNSHFSSPTMLQQTSHTTTCLSSIVHGHWSSSTAK